jgi:hypothetical protein
LRLQVLNVFLLVLKPTLEERLQKRVMKVWPLELTAGGGHIKSRQVVAVDVTDEIGSAEAETIAGSLHGAPDSATSCGVLVV